MSLSLCWSVAMMVAFFMQDFEVQIRARSASMPNGIIFGGRLLADSTRARILAGG